MLQVQASTSKGKKAAQSLYCAAFLSLPIPFFLTLSRARCACLRELVLSLNGVFGLFSGVIGGTEIRVYVFGVVVHVAEAPLSIELGLIVEVDGAWIAA